jgi:molybdenum cofactor biosynthesis protein B
MTIDVVITTGGTGFHRPRCDARSAGAAVRKAMDGFSAGLPPYFLRQDRHLDHPVARHGGVADATFIFVLPGSPGACKDAWDGILKAAARLPPHALQFR